MEIRGSHLHNLYNVDNRVLVHLTFWVAYYCYRVLNYGGYVNTYENVAYVQLLELPVKLFAVYVNLYLLMPNFLRRGKTVVYTVLVFLVLWIATFMQIHVIRLCMELGIYSISVEDIYSVHRFMRVQWHIGTIMFITAGIKILKNAYQVQQNNQQVVQEKLENELKFLKAQINPHFFFNTLNSLYALVLEKSEQAPGILLKLSELMHYMLYDAAQDRVCLPKEITYLGNYIELEKIRYGDELNVIMEVHGNVSEVQIAPMVLIPLVENAFKHGLGSSQNKTYIKVELSTSAGVLIFKVENSLPVRSDTLANVGGIGLRNLKRRLELLYRDRHNLQLQTLEDRYLATLKIAL